RGWHGAAHEGTCRHLEGPIRHHRTSAQHRAESAGLHPPTGKKTPLTVTDSSSEPSVYETQYEALRAQVLGSSILRGVGLAILLQTGMAGWLRAVGTCANACPAGATRTARSMASSHDPATIPLVRMPVTAMLSSTAYTEAARLIASLVLSVYPVQGPFRASPQGGLS